MLLCLFFGVFGGWGAGDVVELGGVGNQAEGELLGSLPVLGREVHQQGQVAFAEALRLVCQDSTYPLHEGVLSVLVTDHLPFAGAKPVLIDGELTAYESYDCVQRCTIATFPACDGCLFHTQAGSEISLVEMIVFADFLNAILQRITSLRLLYHTK